MRLVRFLAAGLACALLLQAGVPVSGRAASLAAPFTIAIQQNCALSGEICENVWVTPVQIPSAAVLQVELAVQGGCSSIRVHVLLDGREIQTSRWLGWPGALGRFATLALNTGVLDLGLQPAGSHLLGLEAEGQVGGCNVGTLASWGGSLTVFMSPFVARPAPSLRIGLPGQNAIVTGPILPFSWKPYPLAASYDLQIWLVWGLPGQRIAPQALTTYATRLRGTNYQLKASKMPPGIYHWRMAATTATGTLLTGWTPEGTVTIPSSTGMAPVAGPGPSVVVRTLLPGPNTLLTGPVLPFSWAAYPLAASYNLQFWLVRASPGQVIAPSATTIIARRLAHTSYVLHVQALPRGIYHWRIAAANANGTLISAWSRDRTVTII